MSKRQFIPPSIRTGTIIPMPLPPRRPRSKKKRIQNKWANKTWGCEVAYQRKHGQLEGIHTASVPFPYYLSGSNSDFLGLGLGLI